MRTILIFLILISRISFGQEIEYNLVIADPCSKETKYGLLYYLKKEGKEFHITDSIGTIKLNKTGKYRLSASIHGIDQIVEIKNGQNSDTLFAKRIDKCLEPISHPSFIGYCCCDEKCNGVQKDYYNNGILRLEGKFKDGIPRGRVKIYYPSGQVQEIRIYSRKGHLRRTIRFDINGLRI